jgi:hypothetical protein
MKEALLLFVLFALSFVSCIPILPCVIWLRIMANMLGISILIHTKLQNKLSLNCHFSLFQGPALIITTLQMWTTPLSLPNNTALSLLRYFPSSSFKTQNNKIAKGNTPTSTKGNTPASTKGNTPASTNGNTPTTQGKELVLNNKKAINFTYVRNVSSVIQAKIWPKKNTSYNRQKR